MLWLRRWVRFVVAVCIVYSGLLFVLSKYRLWKHGPRLLVLIYHRVLGDRTPGREFTQGGICVSAHTFARQMDLLARSQRVISLKQAFDLSRNPSQPSPDAVAITFDDGWQDNYAEALPVLRSYGLPATVFLCTDLIGTLKAPWFYHAGRLWQGSPESRRNLRHLLQKEGQPSTLAESGGMDEFVESLKSVDPEVLERVLEAATESLEQTGAPFRTMLNWDEVREMRDNGIEFGSHGCGHRILTLLSGERRASELAASKAALETNLKLSVWCYAYPNGDHDAEAREAVRVAGYEAAFTTAGVSLHHGADAFSLARLNVHEGMSLGPAGGFSKSVFQCVVSGIL